MKNNYIARLFLNGKHINIQCQTYQDAENHLLASVYPQGEFDGGKLLINGEVHQVYGGNNGTV